MEDILKATITIFHFSLSELENHLERFEHCSEMSVNKYQKEHVERETTELGGICFS